MYIYDLRKLLDNNWNDVTWPYAPCSRAERVIATQLPLKAIKVHSKFDNFHLSNYIYNNRWNSRPSIGWIVELVLRFDENNINDSQSPLLSI